MIDEDGQDTHVDNFDYYHVDNDFTITEVPIGLDQSMTTLFGRITHVHQRSNHSQI
jgi:hypothetical protein